MFTGLIAATASLVSLEKKNRPVLTVRAALDKPLAVGDSVAVDGVCLTLIERKKDLLRFNLAAPTLKLSNLQDLPAGSPLNIELPLHPERLPGRPPGQRPHRRHRAPARHQQGRPATRASLSPSASASGASSSSSAARWP